MTVAADEDEDEDAEFEGNAENTFLKAAEHDSFESLYVPNNRLGGQICAGICAGTLFSAPDLRFSDIKNRKVYCSGINNPSPDQQQGDISLDQQSTRSS